MHTFDLAIAWCWQYDSDLIHQIDTECVSRGLFPYLVHPHNLQETLQRIEAGELNFGLFLDRASDQEEAFDQLVDVMKDAGVKMINDADLVARAIEKSAMQREFARVGIHVPKTVVLPPWDRRPDVPSIRLSRVGTPFVIKPDCGGGGDGVVRGAQTVEEVQRARQEFPDDRYLVQEKIDPTQVDGRRAWFRVFFAFGEILPCWWDDHTKIAEVLVPGQIDRKIYSGLKTIMKKIARICRLELFSTEIALIPQGKLVVVDPINDQVDLRKKSSHVDGIPDEVVDGIVIRLVDWVKTSVRRASKSRKAASCKNA